MNANETAEITLTDPTAAEVVAAVLAAYGPPRPGTEAEVTEAVDRLVAKVLSSPRGNYGNDRVTVRWRPARSWGDDPRGRVVTVTPEG